MICLDLTPIFHQGVKEGWYDGASIAFAVFLVIVVTGMLFISYPFSSVAVSMI